MSEKTTLEGVLDDLQAQGAELDGWVSELGDEQWRSPTPAAGWTIADQIAHLAWTDEVAVAAATDKAAWDALVLQAIGNPAGFVDEEAHRLAEIPSSELLRRWRMTRPALATALTEYPQGEKMPWFGPPMSPTSMATARFMETWAHGLDVADALGIEMAPTDRIHHVAHIGVRTRGFSYANRGEQAPAVEVRVELTAPSGALWTWGADDAEQSVTGPGYDFCLLVTQRRHRDDLALVAEGADADHWLDIAQAFAGPPGNGRSPEGVVHA